MRSERAFDANPIAGAHSSGAHHDRHHSGSSPDVAIAIAADNGSEKPFVEALDLAARVPQASHTYHCVFAKVKQGSRREIEKVDARCGDVLSQRPGSDRKAAGVQFVEQFALEQVHLPQIWLRRISRHSRTVLHRRA